MVYSALGIEKISMNVDRAIPIPLKHAKATLGIAQQRFIGGKRIKAEAQLVTLEQFVDREQPLVPEQIVDEAKFVDREQFVDQTHSIDGEQFIGLNAN